jgi:AcrR family transcriptional regulator
VKEETRDRLLRATAELLSESGDPPSTRAICERAGVTAPTLYHHFGNKQALIDAVIGYGLTQYPTGPAGDDDPIAAVRAGWDAHVRYGLANPSFYVLVHGRIRAGVPAAVTGPARPALESLFAEAARRGLLRVPVADAAARVLAANIGVTLSLIGQPEDARDPLLSGTVREAILESIMAGGGAAGENTTGAGRAQAAITLRAALADDPSGLTPGENALLSELLDRLGRENSAPARHSTSPRSGRTARSAERPPR